MNCETTSKLISKHWDGELSPRERLNLDRHLQDCPDCRAQLQVWEKYERKLSNHYRSHRLGEDFVAGMHQHVAFLNMEKGPADRPEISGRVFVPALQWLQPIGLVAGLLLAVLLVALRNDPSLGYWLSGQGFLMTRLPEASAPLGRNSQMIVHPGDAVWTTASQQLQIRLPGNIPISLSERGLLSLDSSKPGQESSARLHSGKVALNAPGNHHSFMLDTAAGRVRGQAGRIDITAEWLALSEKKWAAGAGRGAWTEGWQAVPMATVAVSEGSVSVGSTAGPGRELNPGQQAILSGALAAPIVSGHSAAGGEITVSGIPDPGGNARMVSELQPGDSRLLIATTFVDLPLQTILSAVAGVPSSQVEMAPGVPAAPRSLRVVRPVSASAEEVLAAVASYSGISIERTDRTQSTDVVDAAPSVVSENASPGTPAQLTLEMEGNSIRLLQGSGVRISVLAKAIEAAVETPVETASADWALADFELQNVPREKLRETLTQKLGLRFRKESRTSPYYRVRSGAGDKGAASLLRPDAGSSSAYSETRGSRSAAESQAGSATGQGDAPVAGDAGGSGGTDSDRLSFRWDWDSDSTSAAHRPGPGDLRTSGYGATGGNYLSAWANSLLTLRLAASASPALGSTATGTGSGSYGQSAVSDAGSVAGDALTQGTPRDMARRLLDQLRQRTAELQAGLRIVFPPLVPEGLTRDAVTGQLNLLFLGLLNDSDQPAAVRIRCRNAAGNILASRDLLLQGGDFLLSRGLELFPDFDGMEEIDYVEAESTLPISGAQALFLAGEVQLLPAAAVSQQAPLALPWLRETDGDQPKARAGLSLTNTSNLFATVQVSLIPDDRSAPVEWAPIDLAPHQSLMLPLGPEAARRGAFRVQSSQPGLAGFLFTGELIGLDLQVRAAVHE